MSDTYHCQEYEDRGQPCGVLVQCPVCVSCFAHCLCSEDPDECKHGAPRGEACEDCSDEGGPR